MTVSFVFVTGPPVISITSSFSTDHKPLPLTVTTAGDGMLVSSYLPLFNNGSGGHLRPPPPPYRPGKCTVRTPPLV